MSEPQRARVGSNGAWVTAFVLASVVPSVVAAQVAAWLDGTGTRIAYSGSPGASALVVSPAVQVTRPLGWFFATGSYAQVEGSWSLQGTASGSAFSRVAHGFQLEGGGSASASTHEDGTSTDALSGRARLHWSVRGAGVWTGGEIGTASDAVRRRGTRAVEGGAWWRNRDLTMVLTATPSWIGDSLQYIDGDVMARVVRGRIELAGFGGVRHWGRPNIGTDAWAGAAAVVWLNQHLALVAGGGSYLADYAQGFPKGSYLTLGVRLATRRPADAEPTSEILRRVLRGAEEKIAARFEVRSERGAQRIIRVHAPGAKRVELMGEFTGWAPVALQRTGATPEWEVSLPIPPGVYRMNIRIDGGSWSVPPGLPAFTDDLGPVAILRIGE
jgi:hypothetical protein